MIRNHLLERVVGWTSRQLQKRVPYSSHNPFLEGAYAPVTEERTETVLTVRGRIPRELNGIFARIGPNPMQVDNPAVHHWFLGDGMVHGLRLAEGEALWYRNRWVGTDTVNRRLGRPPAPGPRHGVNEVVNTNVLGHGGKIWALVEAGGLPVELDDELNTVRHGYFQSGALQAFAAHPHCDPETGELHGICYDALVRDQVRHVVIGPGGDLRRSEAVAVSHGPMIHDCAITASQIVILDLPITFSPKTLLRGASFPYAWNPRHHARVGLLPLKGKGSAVRWFDVDPCFVFHTLNAFDRDDGTVVLDLIAYPRMFDGPVQGPDNNQSRLERWYLTPDSSTVKREQVSDRLQEFPRFDERRTGRAYRYGYTIGFGLDGRQAQPLYRYDLQTGKVLRHDFGSHHMPSETVFVPRTDTADEDQGWLMSFVYDLRENTSSLVILDAQELGGEPVAVVELPARVPLGFHANWIADAF